MRDEADPHRDVHADAHVHVPHEHALLCLPSLRCLKSLPGKLESGARRKERKLHRGDGNFLFFVRIPSAKGAFTDGKPSLFAGTHEPDEQTNAWLTLP